MNLSIDFKFIVILLIIILILAIIILKKPKIKQTKYKSDSGDLVKSRAELIIANWLFHHGFKFIYEKKAQTKQRIVSDFYLIDHDIYIEFWGLNTSAYIKRKKEKIKIYKQNNLKLIQIDDSSLKDLNKFLKDELLKFKITYNHK